MILNKRCAMMGRFETWATRRYLMSCLGDSEVFGHTLSPLEHTLCFYVIFCATSTCSIAHGILCVVSPSRISGRILSGFWVSCTAQGGNITCAIANESTTLEYQSNYL